MGFLQRFFYGRNGSDQLNTVILVLAVILVILQYFFGFAALTVLYYLCALIFLFRSLSRNLVKRRAENAWLLNKTRGVRSWMKIRRNMLRDRKTYKYLKCPNCKKRLRVPKGKGRIKVRCSGCSLEFFKKV